MMRSPYPPDFDTWPEDRRNDYFAEQARDYNARKAKENGDAAPNSHAREAESSNASVILSRASGIKPQPISWLWKDWLALGKMHIIAGQPGVGKSTIAMKTVSAGARWPDGSRAKQGHIIIWSGEDDVADTLIPRLEASGADLGRVFFVKDVLADRERRPFDPAQDIPALCATIKATGGASLIIIDPIVSAASGDTHKNAETRRALQPLVDMAQELNAAIFGITHFTKGSEGRSPSIG
jgi:putative DNA primase/helicase